MQRVQISCKLISVLILLVLALNCENVIVALQIMQQQRMNSWAVYIGSTGLTFLILNLIAALGMYLTKWWGFVATYLAVIFSTLYYAMSYVPFVVKLLPLELRVEGLIFTNLVVIACVGYLHWLSRRG